MKQKGFTLVEIIIVVSIISILTSVSVFSYAEASKKARDKDRQADLRTLQAAVELYKQKNGRYPAGCKGPGVWSGQIGSVYACADGSNQYIVGIAPGYIPKLPNDKRVNSTDAGYVYSTNTDGTVYKIEAKKTVESEIVNWDHPLRSCDVNNPNHYVNNVAGNGMCIQVTSNGGNTPDHCQEYNSTFQTSYALWGGYAASTDDRFVEQLTENIVCAIQ